MERADPDTRAILLLGHTGFVGRALLEAFRHTHGERVRGYGSTDLDLTQRRSAQRLAEALDGRTILVVAAAIRRDRSDTVEAAEANLAIATNLARLLRSCSVEKCVYLSSAAVYGEHRSCLAITEQTPAAPDSGYAIAKYASEGLLQQAMNATGRPLVIVRPCRIYGPADERATYGLSWFVTQILQHKHLEIFGDGTELRDHLYLGDAAALIHALALGPHTGVFNLATGRSGSFAEAIEILRKVIPEPFRVVQRPRTRPLVHQQFEITKLTQAFPAQRWTSLEEGLQRTYHEALRAAPLAVSR